MEAVGEVPMLITTDRSQGCINQNAVWALPSLASLETILHYRPTFSHRASHC